MNGCYTRDPTFTELLANVFVGDVAEEVIGAGIPEHAQGIDNVLNDPW